MILAIDGHRVHIKAVKEPRIPSYGSVSDGVESLTRLSRDGQAMHLAETIKRAWASVGRHAVVELVEVNRPHAQNLAMMEKVLAPRIVNMGPFGVPI